MYTEEQLRNSEGYQKKQVATRSYEDFIDRVVNLRIHELEEKIKLLQSKSLTDQQKATTIARLHAKYSKQREAMHEKQTHLEEELGVLPNYEQEPYKGIRSEEYAELDKKYRTMRDKHDIGVYIVENKAYYKPGTIPWNNTLEL